MCRIGCLYLTILRKYEAGRKLNEMPFDPQEHLNKQLRFLERSCDSFDSGFQDEAIRIATVLRVLFYETSSSTSILTHLGKGTIELLSTVRELGDDLTGYTYMFLMGSIATSGDSIEIEPHLGRSPNRQFMPLCNWWEQPIYLVNSIISTRGSVIRGAANKDGGAHVDRKLNAEYENLIEARISLYRFTGTGYKVFDTADGAHLAALRQMGYEVLSSPELLSLAGHE